MDMDVAFPVPGVGQVDGSTAAGIRMPVSPQDMMWGAHEEQEIVPFVVLCWGSSPMRY